MRTFLLAASLAALTAAPALAAPCGAGGKGVTTVHYDTGVTGLTGVAQTKLAEFSIQAKHADAVCIFAQVDAQGTEEANAKIAAGRAERVREFLVRQGVPEDRIQIAKEEEGITLWGLLSEDQQADRAVTVSYE